MNSKHLLLGTRKGLLVLEEQGGAWDVVCEAFPGLHVSIAAIDPRSGHLYALIDSGHFGIKLHRWSGFLRDGKPQFSDDLEHAFEELEAPKYPADAKLADGRDAVLLYQWAFATGDDSQPGRIYIGTEPGGLFISDDDGQSSQLVDSLWNHPSRTNNQPGWMGGGRDEAGIHSILVDPRDPQQILIGISVAGVFGSDDGGATWNVKNKGLIADFLPDPESELGHDPHLVVRCQNQPDKLWQQNHCGIFRSTDNADSWTRVSDSQGAAHFGFAIEVDPQDGETAWVIPAESDMVRAAVNRQLCVARTSDGGQTWEYFNHGLPTKSCYDFAFRHALKLQGDRLAFGTAGGSVYVSDDRGETWSTVGHHFPPVYSLTWIS